jgi:NAD(P)-dependent dehydrogenase (short-subunit alcohol dehydrogenase family)
MAYSVNDIPDLSGQTWMVTGATSGVGLATAREAAGRGARVVLAVRNTRAGDAVASELPDAEVLELNLASQAGVREAAGKVGEIDVLVNNAGVSANSFTESPEGFELDLATNLLGPFLLTGLVLPRVRRRIVIVASAAMVYRNARFDVGDPNFHHRPWKKADAYAQSKLGVMAWGAELARRLPELGARDGVDVQLTYPGWAATNISNPTRWKALDTPMRWLTGVMGQGAERGALCTMYAATADLPNGSYIGPDGSMNLKGVPTVLDRPEIAKDPGLGSRVWSFAESATATPAGTSQKG